MYILDTNIFLDWWERRYPPDIFPSVEKAMALLASNGIVLAPDRVRDEINHVGSIGLRTWIKKYPGIFHAHDATLQAEANTVQTKFPGLIDLTATHDEADRYLIALAKLKGFSVVTHETSAKQKKKPPRTHYIPDVCMAMGIPCLNFVDLMRARGLKF